MFPWGICLSSVYKLCVHTHVNNAKFERSRGACRKLHISLSQSSKQTKNRGVAETNTERCLIHFAIAERERESCTNKKLQERTSSEKPEKQRLKEEISTSTLLCLAVALPPSRKFTYLQHTDAYGATHPHIARGRKGYHSHITGSTEIKKGLACLLCKLFSSSSTTINNTLHPADNSFGLFTFTCKCHIF